MNPPTEESPMDVLYWQAAQRDDAALARAVADRRTLKSVWAMDQAALLDDYFYYLKRLGLWQVLEKLRPEEGERFIVPFMQLVMIYLAKQACGIGSMNALPEVLFSDQSAMRLIGFNAHQLRQGICRRGLWRRKARVKYGPVCPEMLANHIAKMGAKTVEELFNKAIRLLARSGVFPPRIVASIDATDVRTTRRYKGCGAVTRKKRTRDKTGRLHEIQITVFGWKVWAVMENTLCIPLAIRIAPIQTPDNVMTRPLIQQAQNNLGKWAVLDTVLLDRGFLDGEDLWWIREQGIHFVTPAKETMHVWDEAQRLAESGPPTDVFPRQRVETLHHGQGQKAWTEQVATTVVGVPALNTYDAFGPPGHADQAHRKNFQPYPIHAVVVQTFQGNRQPSQGTPCVLLTDLDVSNPFLAFDAYDQRSLIENGLWRNGKQYWHLNHPPQRNEGAVTSHVYLSLMTIALTVCFRRWADTQTAALEQNKKIGIQRYWRQLAAQNASKVIAFLEDRYGVFYLSEVLCLAGIPILEPQPNARSLEHLRIQYHLP
jgi:hypothetical protein